VLLHHLGGAFAGLMRAILVEGVVDVDEQGAQVVYLGGGVGGVARQRARQLEEVDEQ
jgi:hypothetical protein